MIIVKKNCIWNIFDKKEINLDDAPSIYSSLRENVYIEEDVVLLDILKMVNNSKPLSDFFNNYSLRGYQINKFIEECNLPISDSSQALKIKKILIEKDKMNPSFYQMIGVLEDKTSYSLSLSPMNEICNLPIEIDNNDISITLFNLIDSILYEISFHGYQDNKEAVIENLNYRISNCKEFFSFEDVVEKLMKKKRNNNEY